MERGTLCRLTGRPHYNHQTWHNGRNVARYVPAEHVAALQAAIEGYRLFMALAHQYADQIIQRTRLERPPARATSQRRSPRKAVQSTHVPPVKLAKDV
jgi:hypothetical protein